jgi:hypothetical protein
VQWFLHSVDLPVDVEEHLYRGHLAARPTTQTTERQIAMFNVTCHSHLASTMHCHALLSAFVCQIIPLSPNPFLLSILRDHSDAENHKIHGDADSKSRT